MFLKTIPAMKNDWLDVFGVILEYNFQSIWGNLVTFENLSGDKWPLAGFKGSFIVMTGRVGVKNCLNLFDVIYGRPLSP